jgi:CDP-diacylglycerol--serine O-phosphatidyltransferase
VPTPANALFWGSLVVGAHDFLVSDSFNALYLLGLVLLTSWLLVAEIPMFSLKFKNLSWRDNKVQFIFLLGCVPLILFLQVAGLAAVIIWYALLSLLTQRKS